MRWKKKELNRYKKLNKKNIKYNNYQFILSIKGFRIKYLIKMNK